MTEAQQGVFTASLPELYERFLVDPLFRPFAQALLDRIAPAPTDRLLDVACGTGIVLRLAQHTIADRGRLVGVDASPAMLAIARSVAPTIDWRQGDAAGLPVNQDEAFDAVTCHQGFQFFADKPAALREMRRVLAAGGRVALATWQPIDDAPLFRDLQRVAEQYLGSYVDQRHSFGDPEAVKCVLMDGGFHHVGVEMVTRTVRMGCSGAEVFNRLNARAVVGMSQAGRDMTDQERAQVTDAIASDSVKALEGYMVDTDLVFSLGTTVAIAQV